MSIINATLVAQAFHFFIAYLLIKYLFFKPIFKQIEQEDKLQESLIANVQSHQQSVALKEQDLITQWHSLRNYFASHVPPVKPVDIPKSSHPQVTLPKLDQAQLDASVSRAHEEIVKKVRNVW